MFNSRSQVLTFGVLFLLLAALLGACGQAAQPQATPEIIIETVPVEVTRMVEVPMTVEVTREVIQTSIVEVPVTVTPAPTDAAAATPTVVPAAPTATYAPIYPTATLPSQKGNGFAPLKVVNQTDKRYTLEINGPTYQVFDLPGGVDEIRVVPEGEYSYIVKKEDGNIAFSGSFNITNIDKHELHIRSGKVVFLVP